MNLTDEKNWIQKELESITDPAFLEIIKNMLEYRKQVSKSERISIEQYNKEIDEAVADIENGEFYTQAETRKITEKW